ncbi:MAG: S-layer homology domain-containing protein, partial [Ruminococcaceae bacterium]|nr:S-layer homology domain-containing protein [Oscillospiraceae bacterium]
NAMAWAVENGIVNGLTETTLAPRGTATRAQIATILMRLA